MSLTQRIADRFIITDLEQELLGRGSMGEVYRATNTHTGELVAVKALDPRVVARDPGILERFAREGEALRQLDHPNIVRMVAAVEDEGCHYLVMEYVAGGSLQDLLEAQGALPIPRVLEIALELADALTRAHHLGIIHRDLKPANVLLAEDGTPRLTDFGIAYMADTPRLTQTGVLMGTVDYLSPEACEGEALDERGDIWSFGVMLYQMLTGERPFEGKSLSATLTAILTQAVPDLGERCPDAPEALVDLVYRMLEKDRGQRIPSVRLVGAELEAIQKGRERLDLATAKSPSSPGVPAFLARGVDVEQPVFVARERELDQLDGHLDQALSGQGRVVFVTGEAGQGKTALVAEFARRAQATHPDLIVAGGNCNAHTGIGDPYLPFREILGLLTGDVQDRWAARAISREGARRLWQALPLAVQALVEAGPDLIDLFLSGPALMRRAEAFAPWPGRADWLPRLEELVGRKAAASADPNLQQSALFEQFTNVVHALAEIHPLLLSLDDMQWADMASLGLLFHLGRRLEGSRILVVCAYRPEEVALGWIGAPDVQTAPGERQRHPLEKVLSEFKRQYGDVWIDLAMADETEGRHFVDALLETEPNRLEEGFRQALFEHAGGHPLFTTELLRAMQDRGGLVRDEDGYWIPQPGLDWQTLPARVEGVIEERIARLEQNVRDILSVASVEGHDFTVQIIARIEEIHEQELLRMLSHELEKRHRLVREREEVKLGEQYLTRYEFAHAVFQQYLYNQLSAGERRFLHGHMAALLEEMYAGHTEGFAGQLARHYTEAGKHKKAIDYLLLAGDAAVRMYAHAEARLHYTSALGLLAQLPDTVENRRQRVDTEIKRAASSFYAESPQQSLELLAEAERLLRDLPGPEGTPGSDRVRLARIHYWMGRYHVLGNALPQAIWYFSQVLPVAQEIGDPELLGVPSASLGVALMAQGRIGQAEPLLRQAMTALEQTANLPELVRVQAFYGADVAIQGQYAEGMAELQRAQARAQEMGSAPLTGLAYGLRAMVLFLANDPEGAREAGRKTAEVAEASDHRMMVHWGRGFQACGEASAGHFAVARATMAQADSVAREVGGGLLFEDWFLAASAEIAMGEGRIQEAIGLAEKASAIAQQMDSLAGEAFALRAWGKALTKLEPPDWEQAERRFAKSLRIIETVPSRPQLAQTHSDWAVICCDRGDPVGAREHLEQAAALWEACGITWGLENVQTLLATLPKG